MKDKSWCGDVWWTEKGWWIVSKLLLGARSSSMLSHIGYYTYSYILYVSKKLGEKILSILNIKKCKVLEEIDMFNSIYALYGKHNE
jgi:hypothetical protein